MKTKLTTLAIVLPALVAALWIGGTSANARQGAAERAGQALDNAGTRFKNRVQGAFAKTRATVADQDIASRVYSRIHWDKFLIGSTIELEVMDGGITHLKGAVPEAAAKKRAVVLARDTIGVTQVVDELVVAPANSSTTGNGELPAGTPTSTPVRTDPRAPAIIVNP